MLIALALLAGRCEIAEIARFATTLTQPQRRRLGLPRKMGTRAFYQVRVARVGPTLTRPKPAPYALGMTDAAEPHDQAGAPSAPQLQVRPPTVLTLATGLVCYVYGLMLILPVTAAMLAVTLIRFGPWTFLLPLLTIALVTWFLPLGFGNAYVARLLRPLQPPQQSSGQTFLVQLTLTPRLRTGLRGLFEDADDVGWLTFTDSAVVFTGDSVRLTLPFACVQRLERQSIGLRGLFLYEARSALRVSGLPQASSVTLAERSSWLLPASRRIARQLYQALAQRLCASGQAGETAH